MSNINFSSPREAARVLTPKLSQFFDSTLYPQIWSVPALSPHDRSLITVAALIACGHSEELPAHLRRAVNNGVTHEEMSATITHLAFYTGLPAAITTPAIANVTLTDVETQQP